MKNIRDLLDGDLTVKNETTLNGVKIGNVIVNDNITFRVPVAKGEYCRRAYHTNPWLPTPTLFRLL